ncbi:unnamed protein product, partial [Heterosigma akashiwo]
VADNGDGGSYCAPAAFGKPLDAKPYAADHFLLLSQGDHEACTNVELPETARTGSFYLLAERGN